MFDATFKLLNALNIANRSIVALSTGLLGEGEKEKRDVELLTELLSSTHQTLAIDGYEFPDNWPWPNIPLER
jgi:hypothetical protein